MSKLKYVYSSSAIENDEEMECCLKEQAHRPNQVKVIGNTIHYLQVRNQNNMLARDEMEARQIHFDIFNEGAFVVDALYKEWSHMAGYNGRLEVNVSDLPPVPEEVQRQCDEYNETPQLKLLWTEFGPAGRIPLFITWEGRGDIKTQALVVWE